MIDHSYEDDVFSVAVLIFNGEDWSAGIFDYAGQYWLSLQPNYDTSNITHWANVELPCE